MDRKGKQEGVGGLRLTLEKDGHMVESKEVIRTFSDGGFYAFGLLPGKYRLRIDSQQLDFMGVSSDLGALEFEIQALAEGDYKEDLNIILRAKKTDPQNKTP